MIYFISDTHGGENLNGFKEFTPKDKDNDLVIHLGDVGIFWDKSSENIKFTDWFLSRDYKLAYVDGNHENFDEILKFPVEMWNGGKVRRVNENIVHLMRGEIYTLYENTFFVMGGCRSSDHWKAESPWWPEEEPTEQEFLNAYNNLKKYNNKVDYILTHKYFTPDKRIGSFASDTVEGLHAYIDENVTYKKWYSGHWHDEYTIDDKHEVVFTNPVELICP